MVVVAWDSHLRSAAPPPSPREVLAWPAPISPTPSGRTGDCRCRLPSRAVSATPAASPWTTGPGWPSEAPSPAPAAESRAAPNLTDRRSGGKQHVLVDALPVPSVADSIGANVPVDSGGPRGETGRPQRLPRGSARRSGGRRESAPPAPALARCRGGAGQAGAEHGRALGVFRRVAERTSSRRDGSREGALRDREDPAEAGRHPRPRPRAFASASRSTSWTR